MSNILSFIEWTRSNKVYEDVHPKIFKALKASPSKVFDKVSDAKYELGDKSGLTGYAAQGSSRAVHHTTKGHEIELDGQKVRDSTILKTTLARQSTVKGKQTGQRQNEVEASKHIQQFATVVRDRKGGYKSNPDGVVPPVYEVGKKKKWLHSGQARDVSDDEFKELTKTKDYPKGLSHAEIDYMTKKGQGEDSSHPFVQKIAKFRKATGISDFHRGNWGVWEHPSTKEKHLVLRDAGFDNSVKKDYGYDSSEATQRTPTAVTRSQPEPRSIKPNDKKITRPNPDQGKMKFRLPKGGGEKNKALQKQIRNDNTINRYDRHMIDQKAPKITHTYGTGELEAHRYHDKVGAYTHLAAVERKDGKVPSGKIKYVKADKNFQGDRLFKPHKQYQVVKPETKKEPNTLKYMDTRPSTDEFNQRQVDKAVKKYQANLNKGK